MLGEGSTSRVYRAVEIGSARTVAVKRMAWGGDDAVVRSHLLAEVAALRAIEHPNVVRLLDSGEDAEGPWIVTELVNGASFRQVLDQAGALAPEQALGVLDGALAGLGALHAGGLVHGDVKPENIVVDASSGTSKLIDVGAPGMGSPGYQAPEVLAGRRPDVRSDLYAMGVVLFEALCGRSPFSAAHPEALARMHAHEPVPGVTGAIPEVADLLCRILAKDPGQRPASAEALLAEIQAAARCACGTGWRSQALVIGLSAAIGAGATAIGFSEAVGPPSLVHHGGTVGVLGRTGTKGRILRLLRVAHAAGMHKAAIVAVSALISVCASGAHVPSASAPMGCVTAGACGPAAARTHSERRRRLLTSATGFAVSRAIELGGHAMYPVAGLGAL